MKLYYKLTDKAQARMLAAGKNVQKNQVLDVDFASLTEAQRNVILQCCALHYDELYFGNPYNVDKFSGVNEINAFGIDELIIEFERISDEKEAKREAIEKTEKIFNEIDYITSELSTPEMSLRRWMDNYVCIEGHGIKREFRFENEDELLQNARNKFANQIEEFKVGVSEKLAKEESARIEKNAKEYGKELLKQWANENGSELLKARIDEEMNWLKLAEDEYFNSIIPAGCTCLEIPDEVWKIKNATMEQIQALRDFRQAIFPNPFYGRPANEVWDEILSREATPITQAELMERITERKKEMQKYPQPGVVHGSIILQRYLYNETEENEKRHVDVISFRMRCLSGSERTFEKVLSEQFEND